MEICNSDQAAIGAQHLTIDPFAIGPDQERNGCGDILGRTEPLQRIFIRAVRSISSGDLPDRNRSGRNRTGATALTVMLRPRKLVRQNAVSISTGALWRNRRRRSRACVPARCWRSSLIRPPSAQSVLRPPRNALKVPLRLTAMCWSTARRRCRLCLELHRCRALLTSTSTPPTRLSAASNMPRTALTVADVGLGGECPAPLPSILRASGSADLASPE